jgi:hypothetical protein
VEFFSCFRWWLIRVLRLIRSSGLLKIFWDFHLILISAVISVLLLNRPWLFLLILLFWNNHKIVFKRLSFMSSLIVTKVLIELLCVSSIGHDYFSIIYGIISSVWQGHFAYRCRLILVLMICTWVMCCRRSWIEIILSILLFKVLDFLKNLLRVLCICLL